MISTFAFAQEDIMHVLTVQLNNGKQESFILSEKPIVTMPNDSLSVSIHGNIDINIKYNRADVVKFFFENALQNSPKIISGIETVENNISLYYTDDQTIRITGLKNNTPVSVFSLDGKIISTKNSNTSGEITVYLGDLPKGVYIISYGERSIKINM